MVTPQAGDLGSFAGSKQVQSDLGIYLREINKYPLLTSDEERELDPRQVCKQPIEPQCRTLAPGRQVATSLFQSRYEPGAP